MTFTLKISNGDTTANFLDKLVTFAVTEGGLNIGQPKLKGVASSPLVGLHGQEFSYIEYGNRKVSLNFSVYGSTYSNLNANINTLAKLINEANHGALVDLEVAVQDSNSSYLRILNGDIQLPSSLFSMEGAHWKQDGVYALNNCTINIETAPFFTDYPSYAKVATVLASELIDTTVDNGDIISINDVSGDITTETIMEFIGAYSNGTQKIYIGNGNFSLETNLTSTIDSSQTTIEVDEDYTGKVLVPFVVDIESEDLQVTSIDGGTWTVVRGYNSTSQVLHTAATAVTMQTLHHLDADSALSYCDMSDLRTGVIDDISVNTNGTGYIVNQILTLGSNMVATVSINAGGTGYSQDDVLTISGGDGNCLLNVDTVSGTVVTAVSILSRGTGYSVSTGNATTVAPTGGSGCTIDIDSITATGDAKIRILSVSATGAISTWEVTDGGSGYSANDADVSVDSGVATFDVDAVVDVSESKSASTTDDLNSNYTTFTVHGQGIHDLATWTLDRHYVSVINQRCRIIGKEAQTGSGWNESINYRVKIGYVTDNDSSFIELDKTDWKTPNTNTSALFDFGSVVIPPTGSFERAPDITIILQVQIKPDDVYTSGGSIIQYDLDIDFITLIPVGRGFRYINCGSVPFFINDKLVDDSRRHAPYVQEYSTSFLGEVSVDGIMPPIRLVPSNAGSSLYFLFEDGGGTASMAMDLDVEVGAVGNYLGLVD